MKQVGRQVGNEGRRILKDRQRKEGEQILGEKKRGMQAVTQPGRQAVSLTGREGWKVLSLNIHTKWPMLLLTVFVNCILQALAELGKCRLKDGLLAALQ